MARGGEIDVFGGASMRLQGYGAQAGAALLWSPEGRRVRARGRLEPWMAGPAAARATRSAVPRNRRRRGGLAWESKSACMASDVGRPLTAAPEHPTQVLASQPFAPGACRRQEPKEPAPGGRGREPRHRPDGASNMLANARLARLPSSSRHCSAHGTARRRSAVAGGSSACCRSSDSFMMATVDDTARAAVGPGAPRGDGGPPPTRAIANGGKTPPSNA